MNAKEHVESLCSSYGEALEATFLEAVRHYYDLHREELLVVSPRSKAALINDYIFAGLKGRLGELPGFQFIDDRRGRFIGHESRLLIRVKKLKKFGGKKVPSVNRTISATLFNTQRSLELLPFKATNAYLGYVLNTESGMLDEIAFLCPDHEGAIAWSVEVSANRIQQSIDFEVGVPVERRRRVRPRNQEASDGET
ncbi:MAG: hypothetical protein ABSG63_14825 [Spirochaetia bacterium]|jgi:hypothetical protein